MGTAWHSLERVRLWQNINMKSVRLNLAWTLSSERGSYKCSVYNILYNDRYLRKSEQHFKGKHTSQFIKFFSFSVAQFSLAYETRQWLINPQFVIKSLPWCILSNILYQHSHIYFHCHCGSPFLLLQDVLLAIATIYFSLYCDAYFISVIHPSSVSTLYWSGS